MSRVRNQKAAEGRSKEDALPMNIPPPAPFNLHERDSSKPAPGPEDGFEFLIENARGELRTVDVHQQAAEDDETTNDISFASSCATAADESTSDHKTKESNAGQEGTAAVKHSEDDKDAQSNAEKQSMPKKKKKLADEDQKKTQAVEIIAEAETDETGLLEDQMPSFQNGSNHAYARSSAKHKFGSKHSQQSDSAIAIEIVKTTEQKQLEEEEIQLALSEQRDRLGSLDQDDYGSDDTRSTTSSLEDETMPGVEEVSCPPEAMSRLEEPDFDVWRLGRDGMVDHLEYMYHDLGVTRAWRIPRATLRMFLLGVRERYQDNPYHNFKHCFCVTQMAYSMVCKLKLRHMLSPDDLGMMLTAAICHDVDHPGLNNGYHIHAHSPLAILYNYQSILEQHHFAVTCRILTNKERNIFRNVPNRDEILNGARELILATDLALHKDIMEQYKRNVAGGFDFKNRSHVLSLLKIIIKCADVSNEVRPENIAAPWVERLFSEYYEQSAREKRERLPVTAYMDPEQVDVTESQEGFIRGMMLPMYNELGNLIVEARLYYVNPLREALIRYELQKRESM